METAAVRRRLTVTGHERCSERRRPHVHLSSSGRCVRKRGHRGFQGGWWRPKQNLFFRRATATVTAQAGARVDGDWRLTVAWRRRKNGSGMFLGVEEGAARRGSAPGTSEPACTAFRAGLVEVTRGGDGAQATPTANPRKRGRAR
jgi:hypothetical protein